MTNDTSDRTTLTLSPTQQAAFDELLLVEGAIRRTRKAHEQDRLAREWERLRAIVDAT